MIGILSLLLEALSIVFCLYYLYGEKVHFKLKTIGYIIIDVVFMQCVNQLQLGKSWTWLIYPIIMAYCGLEFGFNIKKMVVNIVMCIIIVPVLQSIIASAIGYLYTADITIEVIFVINLLVFCIIILGLKRCRLDKISLIIQSKEKLLAISLSVVIFCIIVSLIFSKSNNGIFVLYLGIFGVSVILIFVALIDIGKHKIKVKEAEAELRLHKLYEQSYQSLIEDIRARQHEFDNHINTIHSQHHLYHTYEALVEAQEKYCSDIEEENHYNKLLSKGNPVILGFLYSKFREAEKREVTVSYRIAIKDLECNVPVYKIIELLGNLLNNSMDALSADEELNQMNMVMTEYDDRIRIEISNQCKDIDYDNLQNFFKRGYSEKGQNRGYGLYNVKKICDDYKIELECMLDKIENQDWLFFGMTIGKTIEK